MDDFLDSPPRPAASMAASSNATAALQPSVNEAGGTRAANAFVAPSRTAMEVTDAVAGGDRKRQKAEHSSSHSSAAQNGITSRAFSAGTVPSSVRPSYASAAASSSRSDSHSAAASSLAASVSAVPSLPLTESDAKPDINAATFQCPICLKQLKCKTLSPRLLHVSGCALANTLDMETQVRPLFTIREADWLDWRSANKLERTSKTNKTDVNRSSTVTASPTQRLSASPPPAAAAAAKPKKPRAAKVVQPKPLSLDAALGATKAGSGVGTALSHIKPASKKRSAAAAAAPSLPISAGLSAAKDNEWEVANGVFLLGEQFLIPNPPPTVVSVAQLEQLADAAPGSASAAAAATAATSTAQQLYSWRHYIHETDLFLKTLLQKRQWALLKFRLLQEKLQSEGGAELVSEVNSKIQPVLEGHELAMQMDRAMEEMDAANTMGAEERTSMWALSSSGAAAMLSAPFLRAMALDNSKKVLPASGSTVVAATLSAPTTTVPSASAATHAVTTSLSAPTTLIPVAATVPTAFSGAASSAFMSQPTNTSAAPSAIPLSARSISAAPFSAGKPPPGPIAFTQPASGFAVLPPPLPPVPPPPTQPAAPPSLPAAASAAVSTPSSPPVNIWLNAKAQSSPKNAAALISTPVPAAASIPATQPTAAQQISTAAPTPSMIVGTASQARPSIAQPVSSATSSPPPPASVIVASTAAPLNLSPPPAASSNVVCMAVRVPSPSSLAAAAEAVSRPSPLPLPLPLPLPFPLSADDPSLQLDDEPEEEEVALDTASAPGNAAVVPASPVLADANASADHLAMGTAAEANAADIDSRTSSVAEPSRVFDDADPLVLELDAAGEQSEHMAMEEEQKQQNDSGAQIAECVGGGEAALMSLPSLAVTAASSLHASLHVVPTQTQQIFTAASLLEEDDPAAGEDEQKQSAVFSDEDDAFNAAAVMEGGADVLMIPESDHDSAFSLSQPSSLVNVSQPGLVAVDSASVTAAAAHPSADVHGEEEEEQKQHASTQQIAQASFTAAASLSAPAPFQTARAIIELLSDDEDSAACAADRAASRRQQQQNKHAFSMAMHEPLDLTQQSNESLSLSQQPPERSAAAANARNDDDDDELSVAELVAECKEAPAQRGASSSQVGGAVRTASAAIPSPQEWKPASARKPWNGAQPVAAAAAAAAQIVAAYHSPRAFAAAPASPAAHAAAPVAALPVAAASTVLYEPPAAAPPKVKRARKDVAAAAAAPASPAAAAAVVAPASAASPVAPAAAGRCPFRLGGGAAAVSACFGACACIPAFSDPTQFSPEDLKEIMATFGLKTGGKSKHQMVAKLTEMWANLARQKGVAAVAQVAPAAAAAVQPPVEAAKKKRKKPAASDASPARPPAAPVAAAVSPAAVHAPSPLLDITASASNLDASSASAAAPAKKRKAAAVDAASPAGAVVAASAAVMAVPVALAVAADLSRFPFPPSPFVSPSVASALRTFLRSQRDLHVRILMFQPIEVSELWLCVKAAGIECKIMQLRSFLDAEGQLSSRKACTLAACCLGLRA